MQVRISGWFGSMGSTFWLGMTTAVGFRDRRGKGPVARTCGYWSSSWPQIVYFSTSWSDSERRISWLAWFAFITISESDLILGVFERPWVFVREPTSEFRKPFVAGQSAYKKTIDTKKRAKIGILIITNSRFDSGIYFQAGTGSCLRPLLRSKPCACTYFRWILWGNDVILVLF